MRLSCGEATEENRESVEVLLNNVLDFSFKFPKICTRYLPVVCSIETLYLFSYKETIHKNIVIILYINK
jgi:hypothetical protein